MVTRPAIKFIDGYFDKQRLERQKTRESLREEGREELIKALIARGVDIPPDMLKGRNGSQPT